MNYIKLNLIKYLIGTYNNDTHIYTPDIIFDY